MKLGDHIYIDSLEQNAAEALQKLGGTSASRLTSTRFPISPTSSGKISTQR